MASKKSYDNERKHGHPFPLGGPVPGSAWDTRSGGAAATESTIADPRLAEAVGALNSLERAAVRGFWPPKAHNSTSVTDSQRSVFERLCRSIKRYPCPVAPSRDMHALDDLLKRRSSYSDSLAHSRAPYNPNHLKIFQKQIRPQPLGRRLSGEAARLYANFESEIERGGAAVDAILAEAPMITKTKNNNL